MGTRSPDGNRERQALGSAGGGIRRARSTPKRSVRKTVPAQTRVGAACDDSSVLSAGRLGRRHVVVAMTAVAIGVLALSAAEADARAAGSNLAGIVGDLVVGLVFVLAAVIAPGADVERGLMGAVGVAWLAGSLTPLALTLHQGLLVVALAAYPSGRLSAPAQYLLTGAAVLVVLQVLPPPGGAAAFAGVALTSGAARLRVGGVYPVVASAAIAVALIYVWWDLRSASTGTGPAVYEGALAAVAAGYPVACWSRTRGRGRLADEVLEEPPEGLAGLVGLLRDALGDDSLVVTVVGAGAEVPAARAGPGHDLPVHDDGRVVATLSTTTGVLNDVATADAVSATVRLFLRHERLQREQQRRLMDLQGSRLRLLAAADRERARTSARLVREVLGPLERAGTRLAQVQHDADPRVREALSVVRAELAAATRDVHQLVTGSPPASLGDGLLGPSLDELVCRVPGRLQVRHEAEASGDAEVETALFYVCSEAVANAVKHAPGASVVIDLRRTGESLLLVVSDEGPGGADVAGSGLLGLIDRVAAVGGRLSVDSPVGAGTRLTAVVPVRVSGRTAGRRGGQDPDAELPPAGPG